MAQTSIYDELIITLYNEGKKARDVIEFRLSWYDDTIRKGRKYEGDGDAFLVALKEIKNLDPIYNDGYGFQEVYGWIKFKDNTWLTRDEYDGAEAWEYRCPPTLEPKPAVKTFVKDICDNKTMVICDNSMYENAEKIISEIDGIQLCPESTKDIKGAIYILPISDYLDTPEKLCDVVYPFYHSKVFLTISNDIDFMSKGFRLKEWKLLAHMYEPFVLMPGLLTQTKTLEVRTILERRLEITLKNI